jgi:hypothetical protein
MASGASRLVYLASESDTSAPMTEPSTAPSSASADEAASAAVPVPVFVGMLPVPIYLLLDPMVQGRKVLDIGPGCNGPRAEALRRAGASEVVSCVPDGLRVPAPDAGADVVLCSLTAELVAADDLRGAWLAELARVLRPGGFCVLHMPASGLQREGQTARGPLSACTDMLLAHFATVDVVEQTQVTGLSFHVSGTDDLAVNESLMRMSGAADHILAFCTDRHDRPWTLAESLFVPTEVGARQAGVPGELVAWQGEVVRLEARCAELVHERDGTREERMTLQDRTDRLERTVASLRKEVERTLRQLSNDAAAREILTLERSELHRKLAEATQKASEAAQIADKRQGALRALEKEVARLRAARGQAR